MTIEPQVAFSSVSTRGSSVTIVNLGAQLGYLVTPAQRNSAYVAANAAFQSFSYGGYGGPQSGLGIGGAVGYRMRVGTGFAVRFEGRYRHWLGDFADLNEYGFGIRLGGII